MELTNYHMYFLVGLTFSGIIAAGLRNHFKASLICAVCLSLIGISYLTFGFYAVKETTEGINGDSKMMFRTLLLLETPVSKVLYKPLAQAYIAVLISIEIFILHFIQRAKKAKK